MAISVVLTCLVVLGLLTMVLVRPLGSQMESDPEFDKLYCETFPEDC